MWLKGQELLGGSTSYNNLTVLITWWIPAHQPHFPYPTTASNWPGRCLKPDAHQPYRKVVPSPGCHSNSSRYLHRVVGDGVIFAADCPSSKVLMKWTRPHCSHPHIGHSCHQKWVAFVEEAGAAGRCMDVRESAIFCILEFTGASDWLVTLWLTGERSQIFRVALLGSSGWVYPSFPMLWCWPFPVCFSHTASPLLLKKIKSPFMCWKEKTGTFTQFRKPSAFCGVFVFQLRGRSSSNIPSLWTFLRAHHVILHMSLTARVRVFVLQVPVPNPHVSVYRCCSSRTSLKSSMWQGAGPSSNLSVLWVSRSTDDGERFYVNCPEAGTGHHAAA